MPPSAKVSLPVIKALSSEARKSATAAMSSGSLMRPSGVRAIRSAIAASLLPVLASPRSRPGVSVGPGERTLMRIPVPLRSSAPAADEIADRRLARAVNAEGRRSHRGRRRSREDDGAAVPHQRKSLLHGEDRAFDIHTENKVEGRFRDLAQGLQRTQAGVR